MPCAGGNTGYGGERDATRRLIHAGKGMRSTVVRVCRKNMSFGLRIGLNPSLREAMLLVATIAEVRIAAGRASKVDGAARPTRN